MLGFDNDGPTVFDIYKDRIEYDLMVYLDE